MQALRAAKAWRLSAVGRRICAGRGAERGGRGEEEEEEEEEERERERERERDVWV
jgi:hypothetical protein